MTSPFIEPLPHSSGLAQSEALRSLDITTPLFAGLRPAPASDWRIRMGRIRIPGHGDLRHVGGLLWFGAGSFDLHRGLHRLGCLVVDRGTPGAVNTWRPGCAFYACLRRLTIFGRTCVTPFGCGAGRKGFYERGCQVKTLLLLEEGFVLLGIQPPAD